MWFDKNLEEIFKELSVDIVEGLSSSEIEVRKNKYGLNKLATKKKKSILQLILAQLNDMLIYILIVAAVISALIGEISDAAIIGIVIIINAIVGVIQESKAEKALDALKKLSVPKAIVKRDGKLIEIESYEIVPGDIVIIDAGRYIPCDLRLIETANLKIDESSLTGESVPVEKDAKTRFESSSVPIGDQKNMAFMSTLATYGRGVGIAVATGMNTQIGKIANMLNEENDSKTPLQKKLDETGRFLGFSALAVCIIMFLIGMLQKRNLFEMFLTSISLAVAAIPEGLPAIVTIVLAIGVQRMIKNNAIVRTLPAIETLGSVNIICSDKTGTLTQNKMTVTKFYCDGSFEEINKLNLQNPIHKLMLESFVLCNDASYSQYKETGDPTEIALLSAGVKFNIFKEEIEKIHKRVDEIPFDSDRKLMTTVNYFDGKYYVITKGAIDSLLNKCSSIYMNNKIITLNDEDRNNIMEISNKMSYEALRVLGTAYKIIPSEHVEIDSLEKDLTFLGIVGMIDPPREEVKDSINICNSSGIRTVMITGDHKNTALAIAKKLNIAENESQAISGIELDNMDDEDLSNRVDDLRVFARVSPEHKVKIVKALKSKGYIVSMTGDGVNDAPSLRIADIGVAMGITGTDVAKGASDIILTDDNFSTIVSAIKEGRNIYNNIKKSVIFLLSCNIGEIFALFIAILFGWSTPLSPIHILWINLITDTLPALSLGVDTGDPDIMKLKPRKSNESLFKNSVVYLLLNGLLIGTLTLIAFTIGMNKFPDYKESLIYARTMAFVVLCISQLIHSLNMRSENKSIFQIGIFSNKYLIGSIIIGILLQISLLTIHTLAVIFKVTNLAIQDWIFVILLCLIPLILNEIIKIFKRKFSR
ncbi:calcium-transporting ATPase 1 [Clostridium tepidiprofundi DSM 19306]|uniref:P-type Ca(2+) transporter n=1 Tax=Clostridium tepidiprofundi DSM 19306 TaxID=1121338 RepID=A0A151B787_9CLOT|nr:calcium-translocating P-type ATPase, PMCA-type [Clostridium tepidiprofundi]KYH35602.1 calcium-transporting ATPase 1 [Clostridium tepidiprofundi DSM 19306]